MAGIDRDDILMEHVEACMESDIMPDNVKSDTEDDASHNKTAYSYIDNELFKNEIKNYILTNHNYNLVHL